LIITLNFIYKQKLIDQIKHYLEAILDKKNWGTKRLCQQCGKKFYDFNKNPILCPCGKVQTYEDKFAKLVAAKPVVKKKEIDSDAIVDGEDFLAKEHQTEDTVISLEDQKEIEETLEKDQEN
jgi:uncharacterized protein (TIGR02300 family)